MFGFGLSRLDENLQGYFDVFWGCHSFDEEFELEFIVFVLEGFFLKELGMNCQEMDHYQALGRCMLLSGNIKHALGTP